MQDRREVEPRLNSRISLFDCDRTEVTFDDFVSDVSEGDGDEEEEDEEED